MKEAMEMMINPSQKKMKLNMAKKSPEMKMMTKMNRDASLSQTNQAQIAHKKLLS